MDDEQLDLKDIGEGLKKGKKDLAKIINQDRFKTIKCGYKFDKWIFQIAMWLIFGLMFYIAWSNNFNLNYYSCSAAPTSPLMEKGCENPFYEPADWTNEKYLPPGEYGFKPGPLFNNIKWIAIVFFLVAGGLNHLIYNRKFKLKEVENGRHNDNE